MKRKDEAVMIVVTGASGQLGHAIVLRLLERVDAKEIGVSVREPDKVRDLAERGIRVRQGNFDDPSSLRTAFEGISQLLLVSSNAGAFFGGDPVGQHRTAIAAAREAGARRILYTSHQAASSGSHFHPARDHAATEALLEASSLSWVSLRNGFYATTVSFLLGDAAKTGELALPRGGKVSWTAPADLAEGAAIALSSSEGRKIEGPITLTASEALDLGELATIACAASGREIRHTTMSDEDYTASLVARGIPAARAQLFLGMFVAMRAGEFSTVDPTLEKLLGRKPMTVRSLLTPQTAA